MREAWGLYFTSVRTAAAVRHNVHTKLSLEKNKQITLFTGFQLSTSHLIAFLTFSKIPRCSKQPVLVNVNLTRGFLFGYSCFLHNQNGLSADMFTEGVLHRLSIKCYRVAGIVKHESCYQTS